MPRHESGPDLPGSSLIREEGKHLGASVGVNFLLAIPLNNVFGTYLCAENNKVIEGDFLVLLRTSRTNVGRALAALCHIRQCN